MALPAFMWLFLTVQWKSPWEWKEVLQGASCTSTVCAKKLCGCIRAVEWAPNVACHFTKFSSFLILLSFLVKVLCFNFCKPWLPLCIDKDGDWVGRWSHRSKNFHSWFIVVWDKFFSWWESCYQEMFFEASYMVFCIFLGMYMVCHPGMSFLKINFMFSQFLKWRVVLSACSWCFFLAPDLRSSVACILAHCVAGTLVPWLTHLNARLPCLFCLLDIIKNCQQIVFSM